MSRDVLAAALLFVVLIFGICVLPSRQRKRLRECTHCQSRNTQLTNILPVTHYCNNCRKVF
jgi:hypothetical protein